MPAKSEPQRRLMGAALGYLEGRGGASPKVKAVAKMGKEKLKDFAKGRKKKGRG